MTHKLVREGRHQCDLPSPFAYGRGDIVQCDCGKEWRASHPGNPTYSCWRRPLFGRRFLKLRGSLRGRAKDDEPASDDIDRMDIAEFREVGYLQELNRGFLHPLGLALEVVVEDDGSERLGGVWDYRRHLDGMTYSEIDREKAERVADERELRRPLREAVLGYWQQPVEEDA